MSGKLTLEPGWLAKTMEDAKISVLYSHSPKKAKLYGLNVVGPPLSEDDAFALRRKMADHYRAWTGMELERALAMDLRPAGRLALKTASETGADHD